MKKQYIIILISFVIILCYCFNQLELTPGQNRPAHHTGTGFRNPFPGYESRDFGDVIRWMVIDRIKGGKPKKPESYHFDRVENDGRWLKENRTECTVTWIGHSTLLVQMPGLNILTDPIWSDRCSPVGFAGPKRHVPPGLDFDDLPEIDVVLISHNHYDHLDKATIKKLGSASLYLIPLGLGNFFSDMDINNYRELDWWQSVHFNGVDFVCTPAQHFSGRSPFDRDRTLWCGWIALNEQHRFYFAGDTGYFPGFKEIGEKYGPFDFAALPIGAYLPRWFMRPVHTDPGEAIQAFLDLGAKRFVPIHWGTFDLADEPLDLPPAELLAEAKKQEVEIWLFRHGETRIID